MGMDGRTFPDISNDYSSFILSAKRSVTLMMKALRLSGTSGTAHLKMRPHELADWDVHMQFVTLCATCFSLILHKARSPLSQIRLFFA